MLALLAAALILANPNDAGSNGTAATPKGPEGALIGLVSPDGSLHTWLVEAGSVRRLGRGIAVPRSDGFWLIDVSEGELQEAWVQPRKAGIPPWWKPGARKAAAQAAPKEGLTEGKCETRGSIRFGFIGAEHFSSTASGFSDCGPQPAHGTLVGVYAYEARPKDGGFGARAVSVKVLGDEALKAFTEKGVQARKKDACLGEPVLTEWYVERAGGEWFASGHLSPASPICRGTEAGFSFVDALPPSFHPATPEVDRSRLLARHADFIDAVASPSGRLTVVLERDRLAVRVGEKVTASAPLPKAVTNSNLVMAQWATDAQTLARWRKEAQAALKGSP